MNTEYIKIVLDLIILAGLGGFIYYALQLSRALNAFRAHRNEFDNVMRNLAKHIDDAQIAVNELKETSQESGDNLHKLVRDAQFLADELQLMNEAGNSLASRLENLAERGRRNLEMDEEDLGANVSSISKRRKIEPENVDDGFAIHDPDFDDEGGFNPMAMDDDPEMQKLSSAAERELYQAMKKNKK